MLKCICRISEEVARKNAHAEKCVWKPCFCHERFCPLYQEYIMLYGGAR